MAEQSNHLSACDSPLKEAASRSLLKAQEERLANNRGERHGESPLTPSPLQKQVIKEAVGFS